MAATVGSLVVELSANVARLQRDLGRANQIAQNRARRLTAIFRTAAASISSVFAGISIGKVFGDAIKQASDYERQLNKLAVVINTTGGAAGLSARQIDSLARSIGEATLASEVDAREAAAGLLTFKSISEDVFTRTLRLSADLSALGFGSLKSASVQLGKALEDPVRGLSSLREVGVSFTASQEKLIKTLAQTGRQAQAQAEILKVLEAQVGGAGAAEGQGTAGAVDLLAQRWREFLIVFGNTGPMEAATKGILAVANAIEFLTGKIDSSVEGRFKFLVDQIGELQRKKLRLEQTDQNSGSFLDSILGKGRNLQTINDQLEKYTEELKALYPEIQKANEQEIKSEQALMDSAQAARERASADAARAVAAQEQIKTLKAQELAERSLQKQREKTQGVRDRLFPDQTRAREFVKELELVKKTYGETSEEAKRLQIEFANATGGPRKIFNDMAEEGKKAFDDLELAARGWGARFTDTIIDATRTGKLSFKNLANSILEDIARITIQREITEPLVQAGTSAISSFIGGFFGGGFAGGGITPGGPVLVGERGPEIVNLPAGSEVIPNERIGGAPVNVNININAIDTQSSVQVIAQNEPLIVGMIDKAMRRSGRSL